MYIRFIFVLFLGVCFGKYICGEGSAIDRARDEERFLRGLTKTGRILERMWNAIEEPKANAESKSDVRQGVGVENATKKPVERLAMVLDMNVPVDKRFSSKGLVVLKPGQVFDPDTGLVYGVAKSHKKIVTLAQQTTLNK